MSGDVVIVRRPGGTRMRVLVVRRSCARTASAARNMRKTGLADDAIARALDLSPSRLAAIFAAPSFFGRPLGQLTEPA